MLSAFTRVKYDTSLTVEYLGFNPTTTLGKFYLLREFNRLLV